MYKSRKTIEAEKISTAHVSREVMAIVRHTSTGPLVALLLKKYDAKEITAEDFVELARKWIAGE